MRKWRFSSIIISQFRLPRFVVLCIMLRYTKIEDWSLTISKCCPSSLNKLSTFNILCILYNLIVYLYLLCISVFVPASSGDHFGFWHHLDAEWREGSWVWYARKPPRESQQYICFTCQLQPITQISIRISQLFAYFKDNGHYW